MSILGRGVLAMGSAQSKSAAEAEPSPTPAPPVARTRVFLPALASAVLLWASFFPLNLGFLAWLALVPLLTLVRAQTSAGRVYFAAGLGGLAFFGLAINWVRVAHPMMYFTWLFLSVYCALYFPLAVFLVRRLDARRVPLALSLPLVWVGLEYFRAHFPTGFSWLEPLGLVHRIGFGWYFLGYTQHDYLPLIQVADVAGVYGVSFLLAAANAVLFLWLLRCPALRRLVRLPESAPAERPRLLLGATAALALLAAGVVAYGMARLRHPDFAEGPRVGLVQGNLPQDLRIARGPEMEEHYTRLAYQAAYPPGPQPRPDLIVWPETSLPFDWFCNADGVDPASTPEDWQDVTDKCANLPPNVARRFRTNVLLGLNTQVWEADGQPWKYNSALLIRPDGTLAGRYDKMHLVPFGEYVPLRRSLPFLKVFTPYKHDYSCRPGESWTRFPLAAGGRTYHFGVVICYEDTDPGIARHYVNGTGEPIDFLVNISNDGWFNGTEEHEQHLAICRFRAVECRRSVLRAVNMGISGIIDPDGRVVKLPAETWAASKKMEGVVSGSVPLDNRASAYARFGDWLPLGCWLGVALGLVVVRPRREVA